MADLLGTMMAFLPADGWQRLLMDVLWQSTIVGLPALITARWWRHQAAGRAWVLLLAVTACAVLPLSSWAARSAGWTVLRPANLPAPSDSGEYRPAVWQRDAVRESPRVSQEYAASAQQVVREAELPADKPPMADTVFRSAALIWGLSSAFLLARLVASFISVRRIVWQARVCDDPQLLNAVAEVSRSLGLRTVPRVCVSQQVATPMVLAFFRPTLLLPENDAMCSTTLWVTVFAHELAHVRRRDGWSRLWVQLVTMALPFQPLGWWMRRSFFAACEEACDDWAVHIGSDPLDLAAVLAVWAERARCRNVPLLAMGMSSTRSRTLRLLAMSTTPPVTLSLRRRLGVAILTIIGCGGLAVAQTPGETDPAPSSIPVAAPATGEESPRSSGEASPQAATSTAADLTITGTCVDENQRPMADVHVRLFSCRLPAVSESEESAEAVQAELQRTRTDEEGRFAFSNLQHGPRKFTSLTVIAQATGKATTGVLIDAGAPSEHRIMLELPAAATLKGRVVNVQGQPVAGALVSTSSGLVEPVPGICTAVSDADGQFEISDLSLFDPATQKLQTLGDGRVFDVTHMRGWVQHPDYARDVFSCTAIPGTVEVHVRRSATIAGQVVFTETGAPGAGAQIEFSNDEIIADSWTRATADRDGRYQIEGLPPGEYRVNAQLAGRPNLYLSAVQVTAGLNRLDLQLEQGGVISGRVIDVTTEEPIRLAAGEEMQIVQVLRDGTGYSGMNFASIERDGTFSLRLPTGRQYLGMFFGPGWRGVNTDRLAKDGIDVVEGQITELEVRVKPRKPEDDRPPEPLSPEAAADLAERTAIAAIRQLGGWVTLESIEGKVHVVEVNMVYHESEQAGREENRLILDECLIYVPRFTKLRLLVLWHEQATDTGLANLRGMESLEQIFLFHASIVSDAGAAHLATLPNLRTIHLDGAKITDTALQHLSRLSRLERLLLQRNQFTNKGLEHLQGMTQLRELMLGLGDNRITDEGLHFLANMTNLELIDLQNAPVTDAGLHHLRSLNNLKQLWLSGTGVTEAGREEMRKRLPNLEIQ